MFKECAYIICVLRMCTQVFCLHTMIKFVSVFHRPSSVDDNTRACQFATWDDAGSAAPGDAAPGDAPSGNAPTRNAPGNAFTAWLPATCILLNMKSAREFDNIISTISRYYRNSIGVLQLLRLNSICVFPHAGSLYVVTLHMYIMLLNYGRFV